MLQTILTVLILFLIYAVVIAALARLGRGIGITTGRAVIASFVLFGLATGVLVALLWPSDSCFLPNILGVWLGDWIYIQAIARIGNPYSDHAHETIPWLLRVPQVYMIASVAWCTMAGWLIATSLRQHSFRRRNPK